MDKTIIVADGLDEVLKEEVAATLKKLGLKAEFLNDSESQDWVAKPGAFKDAVMGLVLLTDDEVGTLRETFPKNVTMRAVQKVVFQMGALVGQLGADKVLAIYHQRQNFELPLEHADLEYLAHDPAGRWQFDFVKKLKKSGCEVDANLLL